MGVLLLASQWNDWASLVFIGFLALVGLVAFIIFPLLMFAAAYFERITLRPLEPADASATGGRNVAVVDEALRAGFQRVGTFMDRQSRILSDSVTMLLSADRIIRVYVIHSRVSRYSLTTRLQSGRSIRTADVGGVEDLSGIEDQQSLPRVPLDVVLYYHQQRVRAAGEPAVAFDPGSLAEEELAFQRERVARMVQMGWARYRDVGGQSWSYSLNGAWQIVCYYLKTTGRVNQQSKLAKAKADELRQWRLTAARPPMDTTPLPK